ncbi:hypothetical protein BDW59DRAFT_163442 [Aspergillus cavernicola]|uniref:BTB domain-containing protein n=1 Tax=Aspergillus cavernicola TaxID=176166 RepID=A0ABR4I691_9EURO
MATDAAPAEEPAGKTESKPAPNYEIDPDGDIVLLLHKVPQNLPLHLKDLQPTTLGRLSTGFLPPENEQPLRLRVSSKHLMLASPYFTRMLKSGFRESTEFQSKGYVEITIEESRVTAFVLLMLIIHCRTYLIPLSVSLAVLSDMAVLVDYYECHEAVGFFSTLWIGALQDDLPSSLEPTSLLSSCNWHATMWLLISWVFRNKPIFEKMTRLFQAQSTSEISPSGLPIPGIIIERLNRGRISYLQNIIGDLHKLQSELTNGCLYQGGYCSSLNKELCTCAVLGAFTKQMMEIQLSPTPASPYTGLGITQVLANCRGKLESPNISEYHKNCALLTRVNIALKPFTAPAGFNIDGEEFVTLRAGR